MSHLIQTGNLVAAPELKTSQAGRPWCEARIIHNDTERQQGGSWRHVSSVAYTVRIYGRQAELLVDAARAKRQHQHPLRRPVQSPHLHPQ